MPCGTCLTSFHRGAGSLNGFTGVVVVVVVVVVEVVVVEVVVVEVVVVVVVVVVEVG